MKKNTQLVLYALITLSIVIFSISVNAQDKSANSPKVVPLKPLPSDLVVFFAGEWEGSGQFSNGKEINAVVKFSSELDNQWLLYSHQDLAPNKYRAMGMWGFERLSGKFIMILQDNFGGSRKFESDGWIDGKVTFVNNVVTSTRNYSERFVFERLSVKSFKMSYEVKKDGKEWRLGDYLIFRRRA